MAFDESESFFGNFKDKRLLNSLYRNIERNTKIVPFGTIEFNFSRAVTADGILQFSFEDMNTIVFTLLFNNDKNTIYSEIFMAMFNAFFPDKKSNQHHRRLLNIFKFIKRQPLNMNRFLSILIKNKRGFYNNYVKNLMNSVLDIIFEELRNRYLLELIRKNDPSISDTARERLATTISNYEYLYRLVQMTRDSQDFSRIINNFLDKFIQEKVKFHSLIPVNIYYGILKIYNIKSPERLTFNEGLLIEKIIIDSFSHNRIVKHNIDLARDTSGKKGEFDIIVGSFDKKKKTIKITDVYDIKRSARLIPDDIDKFDSAVSDEDIHFYSIDSVKGVVGKKMPSFRKGYIFVNDWNTEVETMYKLRDIIINIIKENASRGEFFTTFIDMIKFGTNGPYLQLSPKYYRILSSIIERENEILQRKLSSYVIRKYVKSIF